MNCFVRFVALSAIFIAPLAGYTQTYPSKPVRILVATPSGGPLDVVARGSAQVLTPVLGQPFVVENRAGADSMIAGEACARSAPDGHVLCARKPASIHSGRAGSRSSASPIALRKVVLVRPEVSG